jgi:hypothetical protein
LKVLGLRALFEADAGTRTPDPFITSEVLYQLSYVGILALQCGFGQPRQQHCVAGWNTNGTLLAENALHRTAHLTRATEALNARGGDGR